MMPLAPSYLQSWSLQTALRKDIFVVLVGWWQTFTLVLGGAWPRRSCLSLVALWPEADAHIQRVECVAAVLTLVSLAPLLSGRRVLWFCDNSSVLGSLVKKQIE